jgi:hypothetical protein
MPVGRMVPYVPYDSPCDRMIVPYGVCHNRRIKQFLAADSRYLCAQLSTVATQFAPAPYLPHKLIMLPLFTRGRVILLDENQLLRLTQAQPHSRYIWFVDVSKSVLGRCVGVTIELWIERWRG